MIPYSLLDLSPIAEGFDAAQSLRNTLDLAQHAERWGYRRYWLAEHHNMPGIASAATSIIIGHVANGTSTIRVGSGGVMLPNHAPLIIAEQFGTLATLYGDRIDLGLGRAPGTDMATARALRRGMDGVDSFPRDVVELQGYLDDPRQGQLVKANPGQGTKVPLWILGSSLYGAQLAAHLGLPYAFASHFAPAMLSEAAQVYRSTFQPSEQLDQPKFMMAINVYGADTEAEARRLRTSSQLAIYNLRSGNPGPLPRPVDDITDHLDANALAMVEQAQICSAAGTPEQVRDDLAKIIAHFKPDEVILSGQIHDHAARLRSVEIGSQAMKALETEAA